MKFPSPSRNFWLGIFALGILGCAHEKKETAPAAGADGYPIAAVDIRQVHLTDNFWLPMISRVQEKTIGFALEKCLEEGRFDNFLIAGGLKQGTVRGAMPFDDTDVYKIIEGASNSLISAPDPALSAQLDSLIAIIATGQEADGYLTTWRTIDPAAPPATWVKVKEGKRWESLEASHELYNAGHLYEAAAVHYRATGKRNFLDIALKNADLMVKTFGPGENQIQAVPGHQIIETGLIRLYQITGKQAYLDLATYFLENRGNPEHHELFGPYSQDHLPVTEQDEAVGHAVRAVYMYAAMTDLAAMKKDTAYLRAVHNLWENVVNKKMYLTGGIGSSRQGEAFGEAYELPNLTAYNETCAAIGNVYWNHRLFHLTGDVRYFDIIERTLYNGLISGLSLSGTQFFYPNALESDGVYTFNQGACTRKDWFDCSCCPTNLIRFLPSVPGLVYSKTADTLLVNLYAANTAQLELNGTTLQVEQATEYPWDGKVSLKVEPESPAEFTLRLRIPGWVRGEVLPGELYAYDTEFLPELRITLNGQELRTRTEDGYVTLRRQWNPGDVLEWEFPMEPRTVSASPKVAEDLGKRALERGPLVYAAEAADNPGQMDHLRLKDAQHFQAVPRQELLGGVVTLESDSLVAIPYYAWSNRGIGKMKVWIPKTD
ncbi:glycoside hydrolase family 127 protein [Robiginitalea sp. M366]|uniref:glycoside hydrolase family 127 protein n=1 Tax=Robiginitalea aestuariiviva TaxID=3036903 RepID=UPI00240DEE94|nr:glycoside hydrolase family 127 protein [Robiginitalea aestuariiviva]MDG1572016.1 glycoside hydrolase family 127 protein [Robiginitalea aestuariiviva]